MKIRNPKPEIRMNDEVRMTNTEKISVLEFAILVSLFDIHLDFGFRHSDFLPGEAM